MGRSRIVLRVEFLLLLGDVRLSVRVLRFLCVYVTGVGGVTDTYVGCSGALGCNVGPTVKRIASCTDRVKYRHGVPYVQNVRNLGRNFRSDGTLQKFGAL